MEINLERIVVYSLIDRPKFIPEVCEIICEKDFFDTLCKHSFISLRRMSEEGRQIDLSSTWIEIGQSNISSIIEQGDYAIYDPPHYAMLLKKRNLEINIKEGVKKREYEEVKDKINEMSNLNTPASLYTISRMIEEGGMSKEAFATGFTPLDKIVAFRPSNLLVLAGRTSIGKSTLGLTILGNMAYSIPVGMVSFEMVPAGVAERLSMIFPISYLNEINGNLFLSSPPAFNLIQARKSISEMRKKGVRVVMVDYLQLMQEPSQFRSRHLEISYIIRKLAEIAKEFAIGMIVVAQISRGIDARGEKARPLLGDLKESGDVENSADIVLFIHREKNSKEAELIVAKNRYGMKGIVELVWLSDKTTYGVLYREVED